MKSLKHIVIIASVIASSLAMTANTALAHVVVKPSETITAGYQTFTVSAPNEKDIPTTKIKLLIPENITSVTPTTKDGWIITTEKTGSGEAEKVTSITWSNGKINAGFRDEFTFSAKAPAEVTELKWKAYQTYSDGTVVAWDKEKTDEADVPNTGPLSVTKVVSELPAEAATTNTEQATANAQAAANRAFYTGIIGIATGLVAIYFATRKKA